MTAVQPDRPAFEVSISGRALEPLVAADVVEIDVREEVGRHGACTVLLQNWDPDRRAVRYADGPFVPGAELSVALGFHSDLTPVFAGVIASATAHFPGSGSPTLRVEARAKSILLEFPPRSRVLEEATDADVAAAVAADYGLTADAATGVSRESVVSDRESDWEFLKARAATLGWVLYVRDDALVLRPPAEPSSPPALEYTKDLVELHLTEDLTRAVDEALGVGWDVGTLESIESEQGDSAAGLDTGDRPTHSAAVGDAGWPLRTVRDERPAEAAGDAADARAVGRQRDAALAHVHGHGSVSGRPELRCDGWVELVGVGPRLSGPHYLTAVRHRLSPGAYLTEFQVGRPPALLPPAVAGGPGAALTGAALTVGVVETLDDPAGLHRVKIRMPWRADAGGAVWARLATLDAGDGYGTVFVPAVGQEVLVGHLDGDADAPVVLGQLHSGVAVPPVTIDPDENAVRAIVTPGGHRLTFDDGDDARVALTSGKGHSVVIDDKDGAIVLTHGDSGNAVTVSSDGITLEAASGDIVLKAAAGSVSIDALKINGKASGPSKLESSATFDIQASGPLGLKGALVNIN